MLLNSNLNKFKKSGLGGEIDIDIEQLDWVENNKKVKAIERKNLEPVNRELRPENQLGKTFTINAEQIKSSQLGYSASASTQAATATSAFYCETC